jgi:hypothetical protein
MGDLRRNPQRLAELAAFIRTREGFTPYFYCDRNGFVTIGIGTLVATEADARRIAGDTNVHFTFAANSQRRATAEEVTADWRRVHAQPGLRERDYRNVAQLSLNPASVSYLMMQEISRSADALYRVHPFLLSFDERVAMAFIDTRYNPAGINPYQSPQVRPLWAALDPRSPQFNLDNAVTLFERLWANRGGHLAARYSTRHWQRTQWLRQGLKAMGATSGGLRSV